MSIETLKADLKANTDTLFALDPMTTTPGDLVKHLRETLWPFLESVVEEAAEIDECVADIISGAEDILQPETAEIFAAIITGAIAVAAALKGRINRETDPGLYKVVEELERNCKAGEALMQEIVVDTGEDEEADEDDEDEEIEGEEP